MKFKLFTTQILIFILILGFTFSATYKTNCELKNQEIKNGELTYFQRGSVTFTDNLGKTITAENVCMKNTHPNGIYTGLGTNPDVLIVKTCNPDFGKDNNIDTNNIDYKNAIIDTNHICEYGCMSGACVDRNKQKFEELYWNPYPQVSPITNGVAIYYDPRIDAFYKDVDGVATGMVPASDDASATKWCQMKDPQFERGTGGFYILGNDYDPIAPVLKWNGNDWKVYQGNNLEYTYIYYCYTKDYGKPTTQTTITPGCPNKGVFTIDCDIKADGYSYDLHWQMEGDIPDMANGHNNPNSDYYFNPRIYIDDVDNVPAHNTTTATKWCQMLKHKNYVSGESYINWANPLTERKSWNGQSWDTIPNGDYPRYYYCISGDTNIITKPIINEQPIIEEEKPTNTTDQNTTNQNIVDQINIQNKPIPTTPEVVQKQECFGCMDNNICYPAGFRTNGKYCDLIQKKLISQKTDNAVCENSFECNTNICADGKCLKQGFIESILNFFATIGQSFLSGWFLGTTN